MGTSNLPSQVKDLIKLIFDKKMINKTMNAIGYDPKKLPIQKLSKSNIKKGYDCLNQIMEILKRNGSETEIQAVCNDFYSYIPHELGFKEMHDFILDTPEKVQQKLEHLSSLEGIQMAIEILEDSGDKNESVIDAIYAKLRCQIKPIPRTVRKGSFVELIDVSRLALSR
jgi:poly [ADP-ribose] polymerase